MDLNYPYEIKDLSEEENSELLRYFKGLQDGYVRIGPKGYFFTDGFKEDAPKIYHMALRSDDVWVVTLPKSGTTLTQELVWVVANDCDYEKALSTSLLQRFPFLEMGMIVNSKKGKALHKHFLDNGSEAQKVRAKALFRSSVNAVEELPSPRFIKSHLPLSLLPPALLDTCKVVHIARDPRDVAVSYYYHCRLFLTTNFTGDFKTFWKFFINNQIEHLPYFENLKEWWEQRNHPNLLFLFYEELLKRVNLTCLSELSIFGTTCVTGAGEIYEPTWFAYRLMESFLLPVYTSNTGLNSETDLPSAVRKVADFLGKQITEQQIVRLCDHLSFENFKKNKSVNFEPAAVLGTLRENHSFIRKGKSGGWREEFDEEMQHEATRWIEDNLRGTDLRFPSLTDKQNVILN